ncbi:MAG: Nif3-like dinuclear metal center hexameric protein [Bacteroidetes bacterium]|nr:Nif3-like dinuclear metal center hexameric protein [Bacteroidota bacterium]
MTISQILAPLEKFAPNSYQESYDNCGLLTGNGNWQCTGILATLDVTENIVLEAKEKKCNLIVTHHPIIFSGLKKITGKNYVEQTIITAIKNDIAIYAIHTNLDNVLEGVNNKIADKLNLLNKKILLPKQNLLSKLIVFVPKNYLDVVRNAMFAAGAGEISNYSECSFTSNGTGTFKPNENANPFTGKIGERSEEVEMKLEVIIPNYLQQKIINEMIAAHPYEEVAYDVVSLSNSYQQVGSGMIGELEKEMDEIDFLNILKNQFNLKLIKHTALLNKKIKKIAVCGGAGIFLAKNAIAQKADIYITSDVKYHEFFDAENKIILADIGHWESEQFTVDLFMDILKANFPTFAVLKSEINTNPVNYFF